MSSRDATQAVSAHISGEVASLGDRDEWLFTAVLQGQQESRLAFASPGSPRLASKRTTRFLSPPREHTEKQRWGGGIGVLRALE